MERSNAGSRTHISFLTIALTRFLGRCCIYRLRGDGCRAKGPVRLYGRVRSQERVRTPVLPKYSSTSLVHAAVRTYWW